MLYERRFSPISKYGMTLIVVFAGFSKLAELRNLRPLLIGTSLMLFQQITGQPSVLYYAASIFKEAGFAGASEATAVSIILGAFKLLMTGI